MRYLKNLSACDIYDIFCLMSVIAGMLYSPFFSSVGLGLMVLRVLFIGDYKTKLYNIKSNPKIIIVLLSIFLLNLAGLIYTCDINQGLWEIYHKFPFLIVPLFLCSIMPFKKEKIFTVFIFYILCLVFGTVAGVVNYFQNPYAEARELVPFSRNISFSVNLAFAVSVMLVTAYRKKTLRALLIVLSLVFIGYMLLAKMLTGIITVFIIFLAGLIFQIKKHNKKIIAVYGSVFFAVILFAVWWGYQQYTDYFVAKESFSENLSARTQEGNGYMNINDNFIENGYYVNKYICVSEVERSWKARTGENLEDTCISIDGQKGKYKYSQIIYRYLNSKGLRKDAQGVNQLSEQDIANIKAGFANYVYAEKFSLRPRIYQTFFEIERFSQHSQVQDMSVIQRIVWSANALGVIKENIVAGTGTGCEHITMKSRLEKTYPNLAEINDDPHNLFIFITVEFGLIGLIILLFYLIYPQYRLKLYNNTYFIVFFITLTCWMFAESFFERFDGMIFTNILYCGFCFYKKA